ncbi:ABC transporter ATP-binding protein [Alsobacter soli]|uniref:ABC transporter ATP-binding protein n=2 Tax=Alsobacter soli TaxID=2109933 RepID=A0A2T1HLT8_9HYPH|nr:ABC transporter ATP-binding protein [Alsobacter soli]
MSSEPLVRARGLGKAFMLCDSPWRRLAWSAFGRGGGEPFWALRDIDLDLGPGDCVGIIGRNGAGKSTLLELLSGVLRPTEGVVETRGRVAALLQLGVGFHPDFSGRENVFLAGALLGLGDGEIRDRLQAIAAFADLGDFIEKPVREYSSGMFARLAFSVCAHAEPDILVVDEILGVGDFRFQQKAMRFLRNFRRRGILLFVSHNEHSVAALCDRVIWIDRGRIAAQGSARSVLAAYRTEMARLMRPGAAFEARLGQSELVETALPSVRRPFEPDDPPPPEGGGRLLAITLTAGGRPLVEARGGERLRLAVRFAVERAGEQASVAFVLRNPRGQAVFGGRTGPAGSGAVAGEWRCAFSVLLPHLPTGDYGIDVFLLAEGQEHPRCLDLREAAALVAVVSTHVSGGLANTAMRRAEILQLVEPIAHV